MSSPSHSMEQPYLHPWRTARNRSIFDTLLLISLAAVAASLPLEGVVLSEGSRTFTFYFSVLAAGLAAFRLPYLIRSLLRSPRMLLIFAAFGLGIILYYIRPFGRNSDINLLVQLFILAIMFMYIADDPHARRVIMWVYLVGWALLVVISLVEVMKGNVVINVGPENEG